MVLYFRFALEALKNSACPEYKKVDVYKNRWTAIRKTL
jgi:hypothetical protein